MGQDEAMPHRYTAHWFLLPRSAHPSKGHLLAESCSHRAERGEPAAPEDLLRAKLRTDLRASIRHSPDKWRPIFGISLLLAHPFLRMMLTGASRDHDCLEPRQSEQTV